MRSRFTRYFDRWLLGAAMMVVAFVAERILVRFLRQKPASLPQPGFHATFADDD